MSLLSSREALLLVIAGMAAQHYEVSIFPSPAMNAPNHSLQFDYES